MMLLVIALNFGSTIQAFIIFAVLPAGICGSILGHGIVGKPVSILSAWGMIALMGILVNDAVVFLDKFNRLIKEGLSVKEAIYEAGLARFRPIILTSLTTVAGLYPLILEKSFQAQFLVPMAVSVAYGVLFGTYFILVFFPALVLAVNDFKRVTKWIWTGKKPNMIEVEAVTIQQNHLKELTESD
jgi:multidrug efflux pump subunit AcrB